jgi:DNA ligase (NAD+)
METEAAKKRIEELSEQINLHNHKYYVDSNPLISDYEFDLMLTELISLENNFPHLLRLDSPSQRVGGTITKEFKNGGNSSTTKSTSS